MNHDIHTSPQPGVELPSEFVHWKQHLTNDWLLTHVRHIGEQTPMGYATVGDLVTFTCPCGALHSARKKLVPFTQAGIHRGGPVQYQLPPR